jgi:predicted metalloprotease
MRLDRLRRRAGGTIDRRSAGGSGGLPGFGGGGRSPFPGTSGGGFPTGRVGGLGGVVLLVVVVLVLVLSQCMGGSGGSLIPDPGAIDGFPAAPDSGSTAQVDPGDPTGAFVDAVGDDVQITWDDVFTGAGRSYRPTAIVLYRGRPQTGCGLGTAQTGPFYCPLDRRVYLDTSFFRELDTRFGAAGDFAQAYVIAHEIGHHVQALLGINAQVQQASERDPAQANALSVRMELQADCLAGVWASSANARGVLEAGDLQEGLTAAAAVGDDRIQASVNGRIDPETWTHGSAAQRQRWLQRGFDAGTIEACDTFSVPADQL